MIADFDHYKSINAYEVEKRIYEATGLRATDKKPEEYDFLSWQELKKMRGVFDIGSHTISHAVLTTLNEKDARKEIFNSRKKLEQKLGKIRSIAYPNGNANRMVMELAEEAGYECGLLYDKGVNDSSTDRMLLHRRGINYIDDLEIFASKVAGVF